MKQAKMMEKGTMMVMSPLNTTIHRIKTTERTLMTKMPTRRERRNSVKTERKRYEKRRRQVKNSIK
jgi:hypothetical protein